MNIQMYFIHFNSKCDPACLKQPEAFRVFRICHFQPNLLLKVFVQKELSFWAFLFLLLFLLSLLLLLLLLLWLCISFNLFDDVARLARMYIQNKVARSIKHQSDVFRKFFMKIYRLMERHYSQKRSKISFDSALLNRFCTHFYHREDSKIIVCVCK